MLTIQGFWLLAQAETVIVEKVLEGMKAHDGGGNTYVFMGAIVIIFIGSFAVLKYMMDHAHRTSVEAQELIRDVAKDHKEACWEITASFNAEMKAQREYHDKITDKMREMVTGRLGS